MGDLQALSVAIAEVVTAPYPVSLSSLRRLLNHTGQLDEWSQIKECQIEPLVAILIYRSNFDDEAFSCLTDLFHCEPVRVAIRNNAETLIERLCQSVVDGEAALTRKLRICSTVLNLSLASDLPVPKTLVDTIERLLESQGDLPDLIWVQSILPFVSSAPMVLLSHLRESTIATLTKKWKELLRSDNHQLAVAAVHVAHKLVRHSDSMEGTARSNTSTIIPTSGSLKVWIEKSASLFDGARATSVLETMMLVVLKACSHGHEMFDMVGMCQEVICGLDRSCLKNWSANNLSVVTKLAIKCLHDAEFRLQVAVFRILSVLSLERHPDLALSLGNALMSRLTKTDTSILKVHQPRSVIPELVEKLVSSIDTEFGKGPVGDSCQDRLRQTVDWAMEWCRPGLEVKQQTYCATELASCFVESLQLHIQGRPNVAGLLVDILVQAGVAPEWWSLDLATPGSPTNCASLPVCLHRLEQRRQHLCTGISFLLLQAASTSDRAVRHDVVYRLKQQLSTSKSYGSATCCQYPVFSRINRLPTEPAEIGTFGEDWLQTLRKHMSDASNQTCDKIEAVVFEVCRDLHDRCENTEKPLREAQKEALALTDKLSDAEQDLDTARSDLVRQTEFMEKEQADKEFQLGRALGLEVELEIAQRSLQDCQHQLLEIEADALQAKGGYERSSAEFKAIAERVAAERQYTYEMRISELEDHLRSKTQAESSLESENAWLKEEMIRVGEELSSTHASAVADLQGWHASECTDLQRKLQALECQSSIQITELSEARDSLTEARNTNRRLSQELREAQGDIAERTDALKDRDDTIGGLQSSLQEAQEEIARFKRQQEEGEAQRVELAATIKELEDAKMALQKQSRAQAKALENAKKAEQRVLAIFEGRKQPVPSSAATTATMTPSQDRRTSAQPLSEFSFVSEDDEDYTEMMKAA